MWRYHSIDSKKVSNILHYFMTSILKMTASCCIIFVKLNLCPLGVSLTLRDKRLITPSIFQLNKRTQNTT